MITICNIPCWLPQKFMEKPAGTIRNCCNKSPLPCMLHSPFVLVLAIAQSVICPSHSLLHLTHIAYAQRPFLYTNEGKYIPMHSSWPTSCLLWTFYVCLLYTLTLLCVCQSRTYNFLLVALGLGSQQEVASPNDYRIQLTMATRIAEIAIKWCNRVLWPYHLLTEIPILIVIKSPGVLISNS